MTTNVQRALSDAYASRGDKPREIPRCFKLSNLMIAKLDDLVEEERAKANGIWASIPNRTDVIRNLIHKAWKELEARAAAELQAELKKSVKKLGVKTRKAKS
jgi:hypothetical protein